MCFGHQVRKGDCGHGQAARDAGSSELSRDGPCGRSQQVEGKMRNNTQRSLLHCPAAIKFKVPLRRAQLQHFVLCSREMNNCGLVWSAREYCWTGCLFSFCVQRAIIPSAKAYRLFDYRFNDFSLEDEETLKVCSMFKKSQVLLTVTQFGCDASGLHPHVPRLGSDWKVSHRVRRPLPVAP